MWQQQFMRPIDSRVLPLGATAMALMGAIVMPQQSLAATLSRANADIKLFDFSHAVESVFVDGETTATIENTLENQVSADADIAAEFDDVTNIATSSARTIAQGSVPGYSGIAKATSIFQELNFAVGAGDLFQFNVATVLDVFATATHPWREDAMATGNVAFQIFRVHPDNSLKLLDRITLVGLDTDNHDSIFTLKAGKNFTVKTQQQGSKLLLSGLFSRKFKEATNLRIMAFNQTQSEVFADVPEPTMILAFVGITGLTLRSRRRSHASRMVRGYV
jgi:hypothetical protein